METCAPSVTRCSRSARLSMHVPAGSVLTFKGGPSEGLSKAILGGPAEVLGRQFSQGTELRFFYAPRRMLGDDVCLITGLVLVDSQELNGHTWGPGDLWFEFDKGQPRRVTLASPRRLGGEGLRRRRPPHPR